MQSCYTNGEGMELSQLKSNYEGVLSSITSSEFILGKDLYSGVFLAQPFDEYWLSDKRVMIVGRETAGWNTKNKLNTISRIVEANASNSLSSVISESFERYSWHLLDKKGGIIRKKSSSWFQRFYADVAKRLDLDPRALIYQNLFAWDFNGKSPVNRGMSEFNTIQNLSIRLISESIKYSKPDIIIFAAGCNKNNDQTIKNMCNDYFNGFNSLEVISGKYWRFEFNGIECIRIAHPRAQSHEHPLYREKSMQAVVEKFV